MLDRAAVLGDQLLRIAEKEQTGYSWRAVAHRFPYNLTGFSHGTSGIGYALLELHAATGEAKYSRGPSRHSRTDEAGLTGRRPTGRTSVRRRSVRRGNSLGGCDMLATGVTGRPVWASPGFALTNFWAMTFTEKKRNMHWILRAERWIPRSVRGRRSRLLALPWSVGARSNPAIRAPNTRARMAQTQDDLSARVAQVARLGIDQQATAGAGHTPGLMVGQAGTGLFYLSLTHATTPILFPSKLEWKNSA